MIKHVNGQEVPQVNSVKTKSYPGATTEDLINYIKPMLVKNQTWALYILA